MVLELFCFVFKKWLQLCLVEMVWSLENLQALFGRKFVEWESANNMTFCLGYHTTTKSYPGCT